MPGLPAIFASALAIAGATSASAAERRAPVAIHVRALIEAGPLPPRALALSPVDSGRIAVLLAESLRLYRIDGTMLELLAEQPLPQPYRVVRNPGGILAPSSDRKTLWALTSCAAQALLVDVRDDHLSERARADAVPWSGAAAGIRYRDGTNLIEGPLAGFGPGPFVALAAERGVAVAHDGEVFPPLLEGDAQPRAGSAAATLSDSLVALSSAGPPAETDTILLAARTTQRLELVKELEVGGSVRALAALPARGRTKLFAAVDRSDASRLLLIELVHP
jgi:hypothetical protein